MSLARDRGGREGPLLVLLHGLGATRQVWSPLIPRVERDWGGRWVAFDLPGHGASPGSWSYRLGAAAARVAEAVAEERPEGRVVLLGHSLGASVALTLASGWFGLSPRAVLGLGLKTVWSEAELESFARRAATPAKVLPDRESAMTLYLKVSGLFGLAAADASLAQAGVRPAGDGWRLAMDPAANGVERPPMAALSAAAAAPFALACGGEDRMADPEDLRRWDPGARILPGLGHNAMVEDPDAVWAWASATLAGLP